MVVGLLLIGITWFHGPDRSGPSIRAPIIVAGANTGVGRNG